MAHAGVDPVDLIIRGDSVIQRNGMIGTRSIRMQLHTRRFMYNQTKIILVQHLNLCPPGFNINGLRCKKGQPKPVPCELNSVICLELTKQLFWKRKFCEQPLLQPFPTTLPTFDRHRDCRALRFASIVSSISCSVCTPETNMPSNWEGATLTPSSIIAAK
ncbi:hypothetical protein D3C76_1390530 [compost metagenome]